jgi:hypothetical protein
MKICPIAIVAGCAACPIVRVCPLKSVVGDWKPPQPAPPAAAPVADAPKARPKPRARAAGAKKSRSGAARAPKSGPRP